MDGRQPYDTATRVMWVLLVLAFAVSVVHYTDNYVNYHHYPVPDADSPLPVPSADLVLVGWVVFTASGVLGAWLWHRGRIRAAGVALVGYSLSGLIGLGHYAAPGVFDMVWWRQVHVVADILCGVALATFAGWAMRHASRLAAGARVAREGSRHRERSEPGREVAKG